MYLAFPIFISFLTVSSVGLMIRTFRMGLPSCNSIWHYTTDNFLSSVLKLNPGDTSSIFLELCCGFYVNFTLLFQNMRPSAEDLPEDLALIVTSCWKEAPNERPNFSQIIQMLLHYISTISAPEPVILPRMFSSENAVLPPESPGTSSLMPPRDDSERNPNTRMEDQPGGFFFCFKQCY